ITNGLQSVKTGHKVTPASRPCLLLLALGFVFALLAFLLLRFYFTRSGCRRWLLSAWSYIRFRLWRRRRIVVSRRRRQRHLFLLGLCVGCGVAGSVLFVFVVGRGQGALSRKLSLTLTKEFLHVFRHRRWLIKGLLRFVL